MNEILRTANFIVQKFLEKKLDKAADLAVETGHADDQVIVYDRKR